MRSLAGHPHGAAAAWAELGCPYEQALALLDADDVDAVHAALALFDGLGARPAAALARAALRPARGPGDPAGADSRGPRADALGLTPAGAARSSSRSARNLTNADIAARLVISEKTVDHHVSAVLAKLGVPSRRDAAPRPCRTDLGTPPA